MTTDLSQYKNGWYHPGAGVVVRGLWFITNALFFLNPFNPFSGLKCRILRIFGAKIGKKVIIKPSVNIKYPWNLTVGDYSWIGEKVWIDNLDKVAIGSHCCLSQGAMLLCGNHNYKKPTFDLNIKPIVLEDGVWLGAQTVVCPGIVCRSHAILTVSSVATSDLGAYTIYRGNPAQPIRKRVIVEERTASDEERTASNKEGMASNKEGTASNEEGMASNEEGMASNKEGMASNKEGMASNKERMASNKNGTASDDERMASNDERMAS